MNTSGRIVVGVDGSEGSKEALRWALAEAVGRGATVEAVKVWHYPALSYGAGFAAPSFAHDDFVLAAKAELDEAVDAALGDQVAEPAAPKPALERIVLQGAAAERLVERSEGADLLVVGHRGHGGFRELLLGSVAHQCAAHARCPVAIIRPRGTLTGH